MASWPKERRVLGQRTTRLDGPPKAAGRAKYTYDQNLPGLCYAVVLYSPWGRAKVRSVDTSAAERLPGVRAVRVMRGRGQEVRYHGEHVAVAVADREDQARDALRAIKVDYDVLEAIVDEAKAMAPDAAKLLPEGNTRSDQPRARGNVDQAWAGAAVVHEAEYRCPAVTHVCLETHGAVAAWNGDKLTVWSSTQAVTGVKEGLAGSLRIPQANVEVLCDYMGGGFGSKFDAAEAVLAANLAKEIGRPVKLMLDREQEHTYAGCNRSVIAKVKFAAAADGKLLAADCTSYGTGGIHGRGGIVFPHGAYRIANSRHQHTDVAVNAGNMRAMRAPGFQQSCFVTESAIEAVAHKLKVDALELRKRNLPGGSMWQKQLDLGAEHIGWRNRQPTGAQTGRHRQGYGCAITQWGGGGHDSNARVTIASDGQVAIWCATQDLGTGTRTALAVVVAETVGLDPHQINVHIGHGSYPPSGGSGGSTTIAGVSSAARVAASTAVERLFEKLSAALGVKPEQLSIGAGVVHVAGDKPHDLPWKAACGRLGPETISAEGRRDPSLMGGGVAGAQLARVEVDTETGIVKVTKMVACQDCGLIVNRLTAESQVYGGVILGLSLALFEERVLDPYSGRMLNPNLEFYKVAGAADIPPIEVLMQDQPERGVIGLGEPPAVPGMAAIANAVYNALGVQVCQVPLTPDRVLGALAAGGRS